MSRRRYFNTVRSEGSILPAEFLARIGEGDDEVRFVSADDYEIQNGDRVEDAVSSAWNRLIGDWWAFQSQLREVDPGESTSGPTREAWLLPLLDSLGYVPERLTRALEVDGRTYPISHCNGGLPIHLVGWDIDLGAKTPGMRGAARSSPHSMVQEFLNRSEDHLWGVVSNGRYLRILRDNVSLTRQAFVEFDLEAMMVGEVYADFALLWRLLHPTRFSGDNPTDWIIERWSRKSNAQGVRALESLRGGVERALQILGTGFVTNPANSDLVKRLESATVSPQEFYRQLLRLLYRLIFLLVAEARELLLSPGTDPPSARRYRDFLSVTRLRGLSDSPHGQRHPDLYRSLKVLFEALDTTGISHLGVPPLGSFLWSSAATPDLDDSDLSNGVLLDAIRELTVMIQGRVSSEVDFRNLGTEELGSIYESLLELHPRVDISNRRFWLEGAEGNERRTSGSYYTPTSLINVLLDSALEPALDGCAAESSPEEALLHLKVCDPACGSGHFLVAAAHRIAKRLAGVRTGEEEPPPDAVSKALSEVVSRCIYGVDVNEMAVELCKVSLWMEAMEPGRPLSFLDAHIRKGNSLVGATPHLIASGIPDGAFKALIGDDKVVASALKKRNRQERQSRQAVQLALTDDTLQPLLAKKAEDLAGPVASLEELRSKEDAFDSFLRSDEYQQAKLIADAWCSAFFQKKLRAAPTLTDADFRRYMTDVISMPDGVRDLVRELANNHSFFHWHLEFPEVFGDVLAGQGATAESGGFDVVLGNPPWEKLKVQEKEWFATRSPQVSAASTAAARRRLIQDLRVSNPSLYDEFGSALRDADAVSHFLHASGRYPLCGRGDVNSYAVFAELMTQVHSPDGRVGCILPTGIATDHTTQDFFKETVGFQTLVSLYGFENEEFIFPAIHHATRFCLLTLTGTDNPAPVIDFVFFARRVDHLQDDERRFRLTPAEISLMNPNTSTCPIFRYGRDSDIQKDLYRRVPVLVRKAPPENPWGLTFRTLFHMTNDSNLFRAQDALQTDGWEPEGSTFLKGGERYVPLYEAKMIHQFDHRFGTYAGQTEAQANQGKLPEPSHSDHADPSMLTMPAYWVPEAEVDSRLSGSSVGDWFMVFRGITGATVKRTIITTIVPKAGVGNSAPLLAPSEELTSLVPLLVANMNSFVFDYTARSKVGGSNLNFFILEQLPALPPSAYLEMCPWDHEQSLESWFRSRVLELLFTSWDLRSLADDLEWEGPPFIWDEQRRFAIRAEIDAAFFHLYGILGPDVPYVMDAFPIVKKADEARYGDYRTAGAIMESYEQMQSCIEDKKRFSTLLEPASGDSSAAHADATPVRIG